MADKEIADLTAAGTLDGSELVHVSQDGDSRKATLTDIVALSTGAMLKAVYDANDDGIIAVAQGGTNAATASGARTNLGLGTMAVQAASSVSITGGTVTGITDLAVADGGTGGSDASTARTNLGLVIGTDVQAYSANLAGFAATTVANVQNRANHTGTILAAVVSDFSTAADARVSAAIGSTVQAYSALLESVSDITLTAGDIIYATGSDAATNLAIGVAGQVLSVSADGVPEWGTGLEVGGLLAANNLNDVDDASDARDNLGVTIGEDVQAWSDNLDDWSALATSAKQNASANLTAWSALATSAKQDADADLTTLASGTDSQRGDFYLPGILEILPKLTGDTIDLMLFTQSGTSPDRSGADGSETVNDAAFADAIDAAETQVSGSTMAGAEIKIPSGSFRIGSTITIETPRIRLQGRGSGASAIITDSATINMILLDGGVDATAIANNGVSGLTLARVGSQPALNGKSTPKQLFARNLQDPVFNDLFISNFGLGIYCARVYDGMFSQIRCNGRTHTTEAFAGMVFAAESGHSGVSFGNHVTDLEIQYKGTSTDHMCTHGVLVEGADGLYIHQFHILECRNGIAFTPIGTATISEKVGGVWVTDGYFDHCTENGVLISGVATNYGRLFFDRCRFSFGAGNGCRVGPTSGTVVDDLEFTDCTFNENDEKGLYVVNVGASPVEHLKVTGCTFRDNNQDNSASHADVYIDRGDDYFIEGNTFHDGGSAGIGIHLGSTAGAGTIENNDLSASTAGTKLSINGQNNGRKIVNNREVATGFSEIEREGVQQTTDGTSTNVFSLAVSENQTVVVEFEATASHSAKGNAAFIKMVAVYNRATAGSLVEEGEATVWQVEDAAGTNITLAPSSNNIQANVIGIAATTINWHWKVRYRVRSA